jgi:hypothetical protein
MPELLNKLRQKVSGNDKEEQQCSIQPHPAKSNDPADLNRPQEGSGGGLGSSNPMAAFNTPGPYIPSNEIQNSLENPMGRDEMQARSAELNK